MIPDNYKLKYDKDYINNAILNIADSMNVFFNRDCFKNVDILLLTILKGAMYFSVDLMKKLDFNFKIDFVKASSYLNNVQTSNVLVSTNDLLVKDKVIILIDDICDTGRTLKELSSVMKTANALDVYSAVLLQRKIDSVYTPNWVGIVDESNDWFVGYGMDDSQKWRHLPQIYVKQV